MQRDALFRRAFSTLMEREDESVQRTADGLRHTIVVRDELFETLCVTCRTEKHAVEVLRRLRLCGATTRTRRLQNALDLQVDYRRRMQRALRSRSTAADRHRELHAHFERSQAAKRALYDELLDALDECDRLDAALALAESAPL